MSRLCCVCSAAANRSASSWKAKSFLSSAASESFADANDSSSERRPAYKRTLECSDSEIDDNDDYASFRGKKQSKKKAGFEANRARNVSPSGSEVIVGMNFLHCGNVMYDELVATVL